MRALAATSVVLSWQAEKRADLSKRVLVGKTSACSNKSKGMHLVCLLACRDKRVLAATSPLF